jgi:hypothetical protein
MYIMPAAKSAILDEEANLTRGKLHWPDNPVQMNGM